MLFIRKWLYKSTIKEWEVIIPFFQLCRSAFRWESVWVHIDSRFRSNGVMKIRHYCTSFYNNGYNRGRGKAKDQSSLIMFTYSFFSYSSFFLVFNKIKICNNQCQLYFLSPLWLPFYSIPQCPLTVIPNLFNWAWPTTEDTKVKSFVYILWIWDF